MISNFKNANSNIYHLITDSDLNYAQQSLEKKFSEILEILGIDAQDPNVKDTPKRIAKMYLQEVFNGKYSPMPSMTSFPNTKQVDELFTIGPIETRSCCSHHFVPFIGKVWIGIIPGDTLLGLSKYARLTDWVMARPQIQEEAVQMLADYLEDEIKPKGLAVVMQAQHFCMCWRGIKDPNCKMTCSVVRGLLAKQEARAEFFNLINIPD